MLIDYKIRKLISVFLCFVLTQLCFSQSQILKGRVIQQSDNSAVDFATVVLKDCVDSSYIDYILTNNLGEFEFIVSDTIDSIIIEVNKLSYVSHQQKILLLKPINEVIILFSESSIKLDEVIIKANGSGVKINNDTTLIDANKFALGDERVMEDLIKRLPGVEILANGKIRYLGKDVSKILFEGDDLLGANYTLGLKNISSKVIDKVEVIDHYINNPLFKGIVSSNEMVMNIKVDESFKGDISGNISFGLGYGDNLKNYVGSNIFGIRKKLKLFTLNQTENIKSTNSNDFLFENLSLSDSKFIDDPWKQSARLLSIPRSTAESFLDNKYFESGQDYINDINAIKNLSSIHKLTINAKYNVQNSIINEESKFEYFQSSDSLRIFSNDQLSSNLKDFSLSLGSEIVNLTKNYSLATQLILYNNTHNYDKTLLRDQTILTSDQNVTPRYYKITSELNKRVKFGILQVYGTYQVRQVSERGVFVNPQFFTEFSAFNLTQNIKSNLESGSLFLNILNRSKWPFDFKIGIQQYGSTVNTSLFNSVNASQDYSINKFSRRDVDYFTTITKRTYLSNLEILLDGGVIISKVKANQSSNFYLPSLKVIFDYETPNNWILSFKNTYNQKMQKIENGLSNFYLIDFQTLNVGIDNNSPINTYESRFSVRKKNEYKGYYFNVDLGYKNELNMPGSSFSFEEGKLFKSTLFVPNNQKTKYVAFNFSYISLKLKSKMSASTSLNATAANNIVNNIDRNINTTSIVSMLEYGTAFNFINVSLKYTNLQLKTVVDINNNIQNLRQNKLYIKSSINYKKTFLIEYLLNYNVFKNNGAKNEFLSMEAFLKYNINVHGINYIDLNLNNPLDFKNYKTSNISDFTSSSYSLSAIQRFFIVSINFNI